MTTPTPRTDAAAVNAHDGLPVTRVSADFARQLERDLAAAQEANAQLVKERDAAFAMSRCECQSEECCRNLVQAQEARQRAEERAQAWREKTHEAEDVALAALASFALTQSVDDYPQDHWAHRAERIRTIRAAMKEWK